MSSRNKNRGGGNNHKSGKQKNRDNAKKQEADKILASYEVKPPSSVPVEPVFATMDEPEIEDAGAETMITEEDLPAQQRVSSPGSAGADASDGARTLRTSSGSSSSTTSTSTGKDVPTEATSTDRRAAKALRPPSHTLGGGQREPITSTTRTTDPSKQSDPSAFIPQDDDDVARVEVVGSEGENILAGSGGNGGDDRQSGARRSARRSKTWNENHDEDTGERRVNHAVHACLTVFTLGIWGVVWILACAGVGCEDPSSSSSKKTSRQPPKSETTPLLR